MGGIHLTVDNDAKKTELFAPGPEKALNAVGASSTIWNDYAAIVNILDLGAEYFWTPKRLVPYEHWVGHIPFTFWLMKIAKPRRFVELGTHRGNSYCAMCQAVEALRLDAVGTAVDTWTGDVHMCREEGILQELKDYHDPRYGDFSTLLRATFDEARQYFPEGSIDLLHIDGTHTYDAVRHDFELWRPTLSERGVVLFHDIEVRRDGFGVWRLWEELCRQYPAFSFVHSNGLGVLVVGEQQPASLRALLDMSQSQSGLALARSLFAVRGRAFVDRLARHQSEAARAETVVEWERSREVTAQDLAAAQDRLLAAEQDNAKLRRQVAELESDAAAQRQAAARARDKLLQQLSSANEAHRRASAALEAVAASTSWRMTGPLRQVLAGHPGLARSGRRSLKAVWWTLTGQLPARLKARRARPEPPSERVDAIPEVAKLTPRGPIPFYIDPADTWRAPPATCRSRIAVHLHIFYFDLVDEFFRRLGSIPFQFDLFISIPDFSSAAQVAQVERAAREGLPRASKILVKLAPNRGRDIAPFIAEFGSELLGYDIIGHFHTKKSPHNPKLEGWRDAILDLLLGPVGNAGGHVAWIVGMLENHAKIVYPEGSIFIHREATGWGGNRAVAGEILAKHVGISIADFPTVEFAEGAMLWARSAALKKFLSLPLSYDDFPPEPVEADGTIAHALERLVFVLAHDAEGDLIRLHRGDSTADYRFYEEAQDFSARLAHPDIKLLAYYLPQFHPIPENDEWHGAGFTEWTKVRAANPLFRGHHQQHIPHPDFGYYLIGSADVLRRQAADMKRAGVHGQIFYHYWFNGKLILERPAQLLLENAHIEMPFCFCWANENWTRRWDGSEHEILLRQDYSAEDARAFIRYLIPFFRDDRYIKIEDRPVLFVYRPTSIPIMSVYLTIWREECEAAGLERPYAVATLAAGARDPRDLDMDAAVERVLYDWTDGQVPEITSDLDAYMPLKGRVFSYESMKDHYAAQPMEKDFTCFRSLVPNWDNTARYGANAHVLHGSTPRLFQEWLEILIAQAKQTLPPDRRFIVVNAWNEWAEGAHLEADTRYGYAYLNAIGRALANEHFGTPASDSFQALAVAQAAEDARRGGAMMMVTHRWGGGTERHVNDIVKALAREGVVVFLTRMAEGLPNRAVVERAGAADGQQLGTFDLGGDPDDYARLLRRLHVRHLHVQHLAGFPESASDWIQLACTAAGIRYDVSLHDYMLACPRIVMVTAAQTYCGEPPLSQCESCIATEGSPFGQPSVAGWRARHARLLSGARRRFAPSDDVAQRMSRYFPCMDFTVRPHPEPRRNNTRLAALQSKWRSGDRSEAPSRGRPQHVVVIGHMAGHKGFDIVSKMARLADKTQAPIRFTIIGATDCDSDFEGLENVAILGRYNQSELLEIIDRETPDIAFLPSTCPESYSFTLSEAIVAGLYPVAFDLGALAERIRSLEWGLILPAAWLSDPETVLQALIDVVPTPPTAAIFELAQGVEYPNMLRDYYSLEWRRMDWERPDHGGRRLVTKARLRNTRFASPGQEAALLVTHSADGSLKPHVRRYVSAMRDAGIGVHLVVAADLPAQFHNVDACPEAAEMFIRDNEGYDFAAWAHVLHERPEFKAVDILYLVNDSVVGPLDWECFASAIARVRGGGAHIYGMTENFEQGWHLQSYFLAVKQPALRSAAFDEFFSSVASLPDKQAVIDAYELSFASKMVEAGFQADALFTLPSERNMTIHHWAELTRRGFPFVKVQVARDAIVGVDGNAVRTFLEDAGISAEELNAIYGRGGKGRIDA